MFAKAKEHLDKYGMGELVAEFDVSSATVGEAAIAVGVTEGEIAKTLSFLVDDKPILIVVAGDVEGIAYKTDVFGLEILHADGNPGDNVTVPVVNQEDAFRFIFVAAG